MNIRKLRIFVVACSFMIDLSRRDRMQLTRRDRMQLTREERRDTIAWVSSVPHSIFGVGMPSIRTSAVIISKM
jgi:hypothetical protein